jgi:phosphatidylglycerol:prolipoprotein diacylglycerol transferase
MALAIESEAAALPPSRRASPGGTALLQLTGVSCEPLAQAEPRALGLTYWFDAPPSGAPYTAVVRFIGHHLGHATVSGLRDRFVVTETVDRVPPGSGRVAVTTRVFDVVPGAWKVTAALVTSQDPNEPSQVPHDCESHPASASGTSTFAPIVGARAPGVILGAWPALVGAGVSVALTVQALLAARDHLPVAALVALSVIASGVGLLGARIYHAAEQSTRSLLRPRTLLNTGLCIQGFVLAAIATVIAATLVVHVPVGRFLDLTAPGLLLGLGVGRLGCFLGGCCAGRPTPSRWGRWSSDRRVGIRRVPTQLAESFLAAMLGLVTLVAVLAGHAEPSGGLFVGAITMYTFGRQLLLPLRDRPRKTPHGHAVVAIIAAAVVLVVIMLGVLASGDSSRTCVIGRAHTTVCNPGTYLPGGGRGGPAQHSQGDHASLTLRRSK